ncbi:hypothetical protein JL09_g7049, partial [Pichia kudriavzevii]
MDKSAEKTEIPLDSTGKRDMR